MLVALGMTLVIATRGIDLSVGAVAAISGSWASMYIISSGDRARSAVVLTAVGVGAADGPAAPGCWNGFLVAVLGIQPIVATLVLMVAGRGLAQVITDEKILYPDNSPAYKLIGGGYLLAVPFSILLAGGIFAPDRGADPEDRARHADRVGRREPGGQPAGRRPGPADHLSWSTSVQRLLRRGSPA